MTQKNPNFRCLQHFFRVGTSKFARETKPVGDELYLLNNTKNPAVMIECGFLSNPEEAVKLENEDYQRQVAFTVLTGISEYRLMQK